MIKGHDAIRYKIMFPEVEINKYADPIESARYDIDLETAAQIADEDPTLLWVDVPYQWECETD